jgi:hypothetical protein
MPKKKSSPDLAALFEAASTAITAQAATPQELPSPTTDAERLVKAVEQADESEVIALFESGLDPNLMTSRQVSPFLTACRKGNLAIVRRFTQSGAKVTTQAIESSVLMGHRDVFLHLTAQSLESQGSKTRDRDALSVARERALKLGWSDFDNLVRLHREALGLVSAKRARESTPPA